MPRCVLRTCFALLFGVLAAFPGHAFKPREEPDEWPTLQFSVPGSEQAGRKGIFYHLGSGEVIDTSKKVFRGKPYLPKILGSAFSIDIRGYMPSGIERLPITPETETVLLIDEIYDPDLHNGGITDKSHIIREKPRGGWAQRFLSIIEEQRLQYQMRLQHKLRYEVLETMPLTYFPTLHLRLEPYELALPPGKHTIQVLMLNADGKPMNPPITSRYATVIVLPEDVNYWAVILPLASLVLLAGLAIGLIRYRRGRSLDKQATGHD